MHDETPFRGGRLFSAEDAQTLLTWTKDLGCNFVRLAHYPHNENEIRLADRMGLLVWSEIPVWQDINWPTRPLWTTPRPIAGDDHSRPQPGVRHHVVSVE